MNRLLLVVMLMGAAACALSEHAGFNSWAAKHNKQYQQHEVAAKLSAYLSNEKFVAEFNAQKGNTFTVGMNQFADLTAAEWASRFTPMYTHPAGVVMPITMATAVTPIDWRQKGAVTPIKDQGQCGSCYAFSAVGAIEGIYAVQNKTLRSFSEKQIVDCSSKQGNNGCDGGLQVNAYKYIQAIGGLELEADYRYEAEVSTCSANPAKFAVKIVSYKAVTKGDEAAQIAALATAPVAIALDASNQSFQLYKSGIYQESKCKKLQVDHGLTAVGLGHDSVTGMDYYIIKNSWGTTWGMEGYINIPANKQNYCGVATLSSFVTSVK
jgi:C1A family cysteine protease